MGIEHLTQHQEYTGIDYSVALFICQYIELTGRKGLGPLMNDTPTHASLSSQIPFLPFQDKKLRPSFIHITAIAPLHLI